ncbi:MULTISPECIES: type IV secretory system conjugative DNA transfer family protein [Nostoc]|uniref:Type IV secretory system conjugative DNA transfer family protein n=1 Tax=Nostoc paludosum FACHB-159 TaxID=2692908 RepID=A0ABR8KGQ3_9NOSO|nr:MULTISPECIES: type IV secretion system DNA-binding domain-containing protein [Nostoc]MBD2680901.1 type IV secretory system conjugative DNA transfer family protein [Nostoc sp. FACHB-857]MBD2737378.1 type IV secretory system conjugative DNA transfer family protein [Nostoc paludosum FACHB-159]
MTAQTQSQQDISNQIIPSNLKIALYSPMGLALLVSIGALVLAKFLEARGGSNKLARARWAGAREKTAARKLALKQIQQRKHNRVALYIGTPKGASFEVVGNKRITNLPEDSSKLYLPDVQRGILVCGGPGSGKTASMINPLIWSAIDQGLPLILYDFKYAHQESPTDAAKGQAPKLAGYATMRGYEVSILAPGFRESCIANPLDFLRSETDAEMARQLAIVLNRNFKLSSSGDASESGFFVNAGDQLAQAIFMLARGTNFPDIMMCHAILSLPNLIDRIQQASLNPWVKVAFDQFLSVAGSPETAASIVGTTSGLFTRFMTPSTLSAFCGQTNIPLDLKGRKMVIFGMDKEKRDVISPLLVSILHLLCSRNLAGKRTEPLVLALDELPTLYLPALVDWLNQNREDGLICLLGLQNLAQLEKAYSKETTNAIFGGCATKVFFNPQDDIAAERFSNFLGDEQIKHKERSRSSGGKGGASTSISEQNSTRPLFEVNQFNTLSEGRAVIVSPGFRSGKNVGLPLLQQIPADIQSDAAIAKSVKQWYEIQQKFISQSTLCEPSGEELENRLLEAERLLPLIDKQASANERLSNI